MTLNRNRTFILTASVLFLLAFARSFRPLSDWMYTHWLFNYELEFVKRGAVGELFRSLNIEVTYELVTVLSYLLLALLLALFAFLVMRVFKASKDTEGLRWFVLLLLFSSAAFQHYNYDLGRFDVILLLVALSLVLISEKSKGWFFWLVVIALLSLTIFIHEGAFFIILPFVLSYVIYLHRSRFALYMSIVSFVLITLLTYHVSTKGEMTVKGFDDHFEYMKSQHGERVSKLSLSVLHKTSLSEQLNFVKIKLEWKLLEKYIVMFVFLSPLLLLLYRVFRDYGWSNLDYYDWLVILSTMSPLALSFLGTDFFRWWALFLTLLMAFILLKAKHNIEFRIVLNQVFLVNKKPVYIALFFGALAGPLGTTGPFPISPF